MIRTCPVCGGTDFGIFNGRPYAACVGCRSLERGRLQFLILTKLGLPKRGSRILHVAPEPHLYRIFEEASGKLYHPCDFNTDNEVYKKLNLKVFEIDLCRDIFRFPGDLFDLIVHNHVLEHLPCSIEPVLREHVRVLAPDGHFIFSVPFRAQLTDEDLSPSLSQDDRRARFGQHDHMRIFGTSDFPRLLEWVFGSDLVFRTDVWSDDELEAWSIPAQLTRRLSGVTNFVFKKSAH